MEMHTTSIVTLGLDPRAHVTTAAMVEPWMLGSSPSMTRWGDKREFEKADQ